jgi:hypothetical protein
MNEHRCALAAALESDSTKPPDPNHVASCLDCAEAWMILSLRSQRAASRLPGTLPSASLLWLRSQFDARAARDAHLRRLTSVGDWIALLGGAAAVVQAIRVIL